MNPELQKILGGSGGYAPPRGRVCPICRHKVSRIRIKGVAREICKCGKIQPVRKPRRS